MRRTLAFLSAATLLIFSVGGANATSLEVSADIEVKGPGTVFHTIEEAVVDALAYSHIRAHESGTRWLMRGGTIEMIDGGFTYDEPSVATRLDPAHVSIGLGSRDVAHFKTYPKTVKSYRTNLLNEFHSQADRANVDKLDPQHRPSFILTPTLKVKVYRGERTEDIELASLASPSGQLIADSRSR